MKNKLYLIIFLVAITLPSISFGQQKQNLKILYVGYSPDKPMPTKLESISISGGMTAERFKQEYGKRMPAFKKLLSTYFTNVTTVDPRDYNESMSKNHDVTIFDEAPTPIKERVIHNNPKTGEFVSMEQPKYVSDAYSSPSIFIGHTSSVIGASLGSKLDWYCLCLDRHAHHIKTEHEIFNKPFKTSLTLKNRKTPEGVSKAYDGLDLPNEIPMWEVDTEGYLEGKGFRVGMVARGWGFEDSPEAEVISGGVSSKQKTAVALGRHGNFFLWGFAGSPDYMTSEAKVVFANAIVYTNKHAKDKIIAKKRNERIATKEYIDEMLFYTTKKSFDSYVKTYKEINVQTAERVEKIKMKQTNGEELSRMDKMMLNSKPQVILSREGYLKKNIGRNSWSSVTGLDTIAIRTYLKENRDYFFSEPDGFYDLKLDEDIKSLAVANTDITMLDKAITLLEKGNDVAKAHRILLRYTLEDFSTAKEWRNWFKENKKDLFFTETGGFVWMINDADANPNVLPRSEEEVLKAKL
ncbi:hypothetical protein M4I21_10025 [Cellulophaga sp. 20_2_10]|uniref:hypothetical protein n=1 Tax=Cellulophaga sp. 20_2_10 TaxID=2942476 RepID=UPI00201AB69A|nr:hypothetical protein [Cellulophaga sp. 20_2_10]MCL5246144.1 hypothetical protein [Cellulophaga sp. 20_2_10]